MAQEPIPEPICTLCGKPDIDTSHYGPCPERDIMEQEKVCFRCAFWRVKEKRKTDPHQLVIRGNMYYYFEDESERASWRGFGGHRHYIRNTSTGEVFTTANLWHNGEVPFHFRGIFPNTHEFISEEAYRVTESETSGVN